MTQGLQAGLSTHWVLPSAKLCALPWVSLPLCLRSAIPREDERSFPASLCCRLPLWH